MRWLADGFVHSYNGDSDMYIDVNPRQYNHHHIIYEHL